MRGAARSLSRARHAARADVARRVPRLGEISSGRRVSRLGRSPAVLSPAVLSPAVLSPAMRARARAEQAGGAPRARWHAVARGGADARWHAVVRTRGGARWCGRAVARGGADARWWAEAQLEAQVAAQVKRR